MPRGTEAVALALGSCLLAERLFVPAVQEPRAGERSQAPGLRGAAAGPTAREEGSTFYASSVLGATAALTVLAAASGRSARTARRAEPVSAAAAAAAAAAAKAAGAAGAAKAASAGAGAAKAAAAAKGAVKAGTAISGSAGAGSMKKSAEDGDFETFDEELGNKTMMPTDRGSDEYKAYMKQRQKQKEEAWEVRTSRSSDGNFGDTPQTRKKGDPYDPLLSMEGNWQKNTAAQGINAGEFNPALAVGVTEPLGYFDPAGFCKMGNEEGFRQFRAAELKHGRVAMMAAVGGVAQHYIKLPGFEKVPAGLAAVNETPGSYGAIALFLACGALELGVWTEDETGENREPGNFGDPLGLNQYTDEMRNREINNGRVAMFAAIGIIAAELYTGKDAIEQFGFK